jgi:hypothetical protein
VDHKIDLRIGPAVETLDQILKDPKEHETFDFAFVDADKKNQSNYYERVLRLVRPGGIVAVDNVFWNGRVIDESVQDADTKGVRELNEFLKKDERVEICMLPIADGLTLCRKIRKNKKAPISNYKPLHPELFTYNDEFVQRFVHEDVRNSREDPHNNIKEVAEQLYFFRLFTEEFCKLLIEEAENCNRWKTNLEKTVEAHPFVEGLVDICEPDTCVSFSKMPGLEEVYEKVVRNHVSPVMSAKWVTFNLQRWDTPAVRKYEPHVVKSMDLHYDLEVISMVGYLNRDFEGGGTYFPRWKLTVGSHVDVIPGSVVVYPGGVSHEHKAHAITSGVRYMLSNSFY